MVDVIAIDGPSGSGKSTVARRVAARLGYLYLDTGAMYRAVGLHLLTEHVPCEENAVTDAMLSQLNVDFDEGGRVLLNGTDMSTDIRTTAAARAASDYSRLSAVRRRLTQLQREIGLSRPSVLEGRDIGTVVFPDADYKFYLDASAEERARRRHAEMISKNPELCETYADILKQQMERDRQDAGRKLAPLRQADDACYIDTTGRTIDEVVQTILEHL